MRLSNDVEKKISQTHIESINWEVWKFRLAFFSEQLLKYNQDQVCRKIKISYELLNHIGSYAVLSSDILIREGKAEKEMLWSSSSQKGFQR